jgi:hypothetical protein
MLGCKAMRPSRLASVSSLLGALALAQCEPAYDQAPPATPQNVAGAAPSAPPAPAQPSSDGAKYASDEYAIGEDPDSYQDADPSALTDFRAALDPYGTWADDSTYGTVWVPSPSVVGAEFKPYSTAGHWVYDDDWVWASDYPWGWAPFHYGRWVWAEGRGWVWIPGRAYRGAWVSWGVDDSYGYVGWYPMGPDFLWWGGMAVGYPYYVPARWVYCPRGEVFSPVVGTRVAAGAAAAPIAARVHPYVPATPSVAGPPPQKLGYAPSQIPRTSATAAPHLAQAQQFGRPSTAIALGASAPSRAVVTAPPAAAMGARSYPLEGALPHGATQMPAHVPMASVRPPTVSGPTMPGKPPGSLALHPVPSFHSGGGGHGGGGHHR